MRGEDAEDEAEEILRRQIERQIESKKRKKYLGPDSVDDVPSTSRARFSVATIGQHTLHHSSMNTDNLVEPDYHPSKNFARDSDGIQADPLQEDIQLQASPHCSNKGPQPVLRNEKERCHISEDSSSSSRSSSPVFSQSSLSLTGDFDDTDCELIWAQDEGNEESPHHNEDDEGQSDTFEDGNVGVHGDGDIPVDGDNIAPPADHVNLLGIPAAGNDGDGEAAPAQGDQPDLPGGGGAPHNEARSHQKLREAMIGGFLDNIDVPVTSSRNDLLYMALGLASRNMDSSTALCNLINLLNAIFATPVLPTTKHLLDQLLVSNIGVNYYFYCESCFKCFGELDYKNVKDYICTNCNLRNPVSDLRLASYYVMFNVPLQLEILLNNPALAGALATPIEACERSPAGVLSDICSGSVYRDFAESTRNFPERIVSFHFFVDGAPLATSSNSSIWPIQVALNELLPETRMKNILLDGLWFGKKQPSMELFLLPFVSHMKVLGDGFEITVGNEVWNIRAYCIGCSADSGARGLVQGIKSHGGYCACNWCKVIGVYLEKAVRYPLTHEAPPDRNHEEMVRLQRSLVNNVPEDDTSDEEENPRNLEMFGVKAVSPLINMPWFDMVKGFFFESMHCVDLGVVKAFLSLCLEDRGEPYYIKASIPVMNSRISAIKVPNEFRRFPRTLKERLKWKAREYSNFILISYPVMKNILPDRYLKTWMLFVEAISLLSQTTVTLEQVNVANRMIIHFLAETQEHYGEHNMSFNLHILKHAGAHVSRWGPLWATSAYSFESGNGHLKNIIHSVQGVPNQVIRSFSWDMAKNLLEPTASQKARDFVENISKPKSHHQISLHTASCTLIGKPKEFRLSNEEEYLCELNNHAVNNLLSYQKLIYNKCAYVVDSKRCAKTSNSVAQLRDKSIVLIKKIYYDQNQDKVFLFCCNMNWVPLLTPPQETQFERAECFLREITSTDEELRYILCTDLNIICLRTKLAHIDFLAPLPNVHNRH